MRRAIVVINIALYSIGDGNGGTIHRLADEDPAIVFFDDFEFQFHIEILNYRIGDQVTSIRP